MPGSALAPLCISDLQVAANRKLGYGSKTQIAEALAALSSTSFNGISLSFPGMDQYRLVAVSDEICVLLRLGVNPNSGIITVFTKHNNPNIDEDLPPFVKGLPMSVYSDVLGDLGQTPEYFSEIANQAFLDIVDAQNGFDIIYTIKELAEKIASVTPSNADSSEDFRIFRLEIVAGMYLSGYSRRVLIINMFSTLADLLAIDLLTPPGGRCFLTMTPDEGSREVIAELPNHEPSSVYLAVRHYISAFFQDGYLAKPSMVILGTLLEHGQEYPVYSDRFWQNLLGHPCVYDDIDDNQDVPLDILGALPPWN